jgi:hypothetical protein
MFECWRTRNQIILVGCRKNNREMEVQFRVGAKDFSLLQTSQTGCYAVGTGDHLPGSGAAAT